MGANQLLEPPFLATSPPVEDHLCLEEILQNLGQRFSAKMKKLNQTPAQEAQFLVLDLNQLDLISSLWPQVPQDSARREKILNLPGRDLLFLERKPLPMEMMMKKVKRMEEMKVMILNLNQLCPFLNLLKSKLEKKMRKNCSSTEPKSTDIVATPSNGRKEELVTLKF